MKWGLIARSETDRGIGIQTYAMYQNLKPDKTLVVVDLKSGFKSHPENYPGSTTVSLKHGPLKNRLDEATVRDWWQGLDVVITVETLYDWDIVAWAKADNVRTVVHGNPEFWLDTNPQPDQWIWPTTWRLQHIPEGPVVPVPAPDVPFTAAPAELSPYVRGVHIVGNGAMGDRNGTTCVALAAPKVRAAFRMSVYTQANVGIGGVIMKQPVEDRWMMYMGHHVLVLPRRYGGLCLPAIEAMSCGLAVVMSDCSPNHTWPIIPIDGDIGRTLKMQTGPVETFDPYPNYLTNILRRLAGNRVELAEAQERSREWASTNRWEHHAQTYYDVMERVNAN